jgi:uncharacterized protein (TIGR03435 family)
MLQTLLENRFQLRMHRETRELPTLNLTQVAAAGLRHQRRRTARMMCPSLCRREHRLFLVTKWSSRYRQLVQSLRGKQATPGQLVFTLANIRGRPVIDRTAFQGSFDVDLEVSMDGLEGIADMLGVRASRRNHQIVDANTETATAMASSKLFEAAVNERGVVFGYAGRLRQRSHRV